MAGSPVPPKPTAAPRVALFVTCLVDAMRPNVGFAALKLLQDAGCRVEVPMQQTCCGQPAFNSGDTRDAAVLARLAGECGDDEVAALAYLRSEADADAVRAQAERGQRMGISGVPFFIFDGRYGLGGAQPPEVLLDALRRSLLPPTP